jgi:hypothetical protein
MRSSKPRESRGTTLGATIEMPFRAVATSNNTVYDDMTVVYGQIGGSRKELPTTSSMLDSAFSSKHQAMELAADADADDDDLSHIPQVI